MKYQALIRISLLILLNSLPAAASANHTECAEKLEPLSSCLPFVSDHPIATVPPQKCCEAIGVAFNSTGSGDSCICHLLQQPHIFGFANLSSVLPLPSLCKTTPELSVVCREESVSELKEAIRDRYVERKTTCNNTECCYHKVCKKLLSTISAVYYKVINGRHMCYCHGT